jgi:hypothetical protein
MLFVICYDTGFWQFKQDVSHLGPRRALSSRLSRKQQQQQQLGPPSSGSSRLPSLILNSQPSGSQVSSLVGADSYCLKDVEAPCDLPVAGHVQQCHGSVFMMDVQASQDLSAYSPAEAAEGRLAATPGGSSIGGVSQQR